MKPAQLPDHGEKKDEHLPFYPYLKKTCFSFHLIHLQQLMCHLSEIMHAKVFRLAPGTWKLLNKHELLL